MKHTAEQLALFEIEPEDSVTIYGTDSIPFLVVTSSTPTLTSSHNDSECDSRNDYKVLPA